HPDRGRLRGRHLVLRFGAGQRPAGRGPIAVGGRRRGAAAPGAAHGRRHLRLRPPGGRGHPHRRGGHEPVRRSAPAPGPGRAIAARPAVLLLDDPLSALDTRTEEIVTARLREVLEGTTTLIVAHRTSTVALADRVALLDGGKVVAVGTHVDLMASSARYRCG